MGWKNRAPVLLAALWWGALTAVGFLVVPLLFAHLGSAAQAGGMAARLFGAQAWVSLACGVLLLAFARGADDGTPAMSWAQGAVVYVVLGMLLALLSEFAVAPRIVARQNLQLWHTLGTLFYAAQWLCALVVLWKTAGAVSRPAAS